MLLRAGLVWWCFLAAMQAGAATDLAGVTVALAALWAGVEYAAWRGILR